MLFQSFVQEFLPTKQNYVPPAAAVTRRSAATRRHRGAGAFQQLGDTRVSAVDLPGPRQPIAIVTLMEKGMASGAPPITVAIDSRERQVVTYIDDPRVYDLGERIHDMAAGASCVDRDLASSGP